MALSATSLEEVIKPDMQQRFQMEKKNRFPRDDTPEPTTRGRRHSICQHFSFGAKI
jgi:hypothetical protein